ncbi:hypothetical protein FRC08_003171 [Ceratobasidium sp. 394]|nr:hypothetical protein FRC08_003171 [Ceratobasidium sp. 394]
MSLSESAVLLSQYQYILQKDYSIQRILELSNILDRFFPSLEPDFYFMADERRPTAAELNAAGIGYHPDTGADVSYDTRPTPLRPRALTGTSNDNPRATKRRMNNPTHAQEHGHTETPSDVFINHPQYAGERANFAPPAYGQAQSYARESVRGQTGMPVGNMYINVSQHSRERAGNLAHHVPEQARVRADTPLNNVYMNASPHLGEYASNVTRSAYGHNYDRPPEMSHGSPAMPFGPAETRAYPMLPPPQPPKTQGLARLPPIYSAPPTPTASVASLHPAADAYHQSAPPSTARVAGTVPRASTTPVRPPLHADAPPGMASGHPSTAPSTPVRTMAGISSGSALPSHAPLASRVAPGPPTHAAKRAQPSVQAPVTSTAYQAAPGMRNPVTPSGRNTSGPRPLPAPARIASPALGAAYGAHAIRQPKLARPASPPVILLSSSPPELDAVFGPRGRGEPKLEGADNEDVNAYAPGSGNANRNSNVGGAHVEMVPDVKAWKVTHPKSLYPGGPPFVTPEARDLMLSTSRVGWARALWEEHLIIVFYFSGPAPNAELESALLAPKGSGKNAKYDASIEELCTDVFNGSRTESSIHAMLRDICSTFVHIRTFNHVTGGNFDLTRPDNELIYEINPRIHQLLPKYPELKDFNGWQYICYSRGGPNSWLSLLHNHLKSHPTYSRVIMRSGVVSPRPERIGAGNGSRSAGRASDGASGSGSVPGGSRGVPKPPVPGEGKGKGRSTSVDPTWQNSAVEGSESSLPSAPSSTTVSDKLTSMSGARTSSSAPTDSAAHKSVARRSGTHASPSIPESRNTNSPNDISQATAIEVLRETQASKREFNEQVVVLKKQLDKAKIALLTREQEKSEHFREQAHELERARLTLEQAKTRALIESQRLEQQERLLLAVRDRGRQGDNDAVYDDANRRIQELMKIGSTPIHIEDVPALEPSGPSAGAPAPPPSGSVVDTRGHPSTSSAAVSPSQMPCAGSSSNVPPPQPCGASPPASGSSAPTLKPADFNDPFEYPGESSPPEWWGKFSQSKNNQEA